MIPNPLYSDFYYATTSKSVLNKCIKNQKISTIESNSKIINPNTIKNKAYPALSDFVFYPTPYGFLKMSKDLCPTIFI